MSDSGELRNTSDAGSGLESLATAANLMDGFIHETENVMNASHETNSNLDNNRMTPPLNPLPPEGIDRLRKLLVLQRLRFEHFYSSMDQEHFNNNEFVSCIGHIGFDVSQPIKRSTLLQIRKAMGENIGTPRRFSFAFIMHERKKLNEYRKAMRFKNYTPETGPISSHIGVIPHKYAESLHRGDFVIAYSRVNKVLCRGRITSEGPFHSESRGFLISFDNPIFRNEWCNDFDIKISERYYGAESVAPTSASRLSANVNIKDSVSDYIEHAKTAVVSVIQLKSRGDEYPSSVLDTIVRCVALILWMKKSVNIANALPHEIEALTKQSVEYITGSLNSIDISEEERTSICRELQNAIFQVFSFANNKASAV